MVRYEQDIQRFSKKYPNYIDISSCDNKYWKMLEIDIDWNKRMPEDYVEFNKQIYNILKLYPHISKDDFLKIEYLNKMEFVMRNYVMYIYSILDEKKI